MKKFIKVVLILILVFFVLGALLLIIGGVNGGFADLEQKGVAALEESGINFPGDFYKENVELSDGAVTVACGDINNPVELPFDATDIKYLHFVAGAMTLNVKESEDNKIRIGSSYNNFSVSYEKSDESLEMIFPEIRSGVKKAAEDGVVDIYIPANMEFETVEMSLAAGDFRFDDLNSETVVIELAAGELKFDNIKADYAELNVAAGELIVSNIDTNTLDLNVSMGDAKIWLADEIVNYNITSDISMGSLQIPGLSSSGIDKSISFDNDADKDININVEMGNAFIKGR